MTEYEIALSEYLQQFLTPERKQRFAKVLENRIATLRVVLIDIFQTHNASAILRSCDAFGVQDVCVVESENEFVPNKVVARGSDQWLTIHRFSGKSALNDCLDELRSEGFQIAAMVVDATSQPVETVPIDKPIALLFGTEKEGLPENVVREADLHVHVPMYGFVESFNVSVATALSLQSVAPRIRESQTRWRLSKDVQSRLWLDWTRKSVANVEAIEKRFRETWVRSHESSPTS